MMTVRVFFAAAPELWPEWQAPLEAAFADAGIAAQLSDQAPDPMRVDYILYSPGGIVDDFGPYTRARAVLNLWAGVESVIPNPTLTQPLCRMVDPAMTQAMCDYVVTMAMRHHLGLDRFLAHQDGRWMPEIAPLASERKIGVMGLGALGGCCAKALAGLGFRVSGWSRNRKSLPGIDCHWGSDGLHLMLRGSEILVALLPHTPQTENILNSDTMALLPRRAVLINTGRGALVDEAALLTALDSGNLAHATLDVFRTEPLPPTHPFWAHPKVTVTPHIAAETRPDSASRVIAENIRRSEAGHPLLHRVDREAGY